MSSVKDAQSVDKLAVVDKFGSRQEAGTIINDVDYFYAMFTLLDVNGNKMTFKKEDILVDITAGNIALISLDGESVFNTSILSHETEGKDFLASNFYTKMSGVVNVIEFKVLRAFPPTGVSLRLVLSNQQIGSDIFSPYNSSVIIYKK